MGERMARLERRGEEEEEKRYGEREKKEKRWEEEDEVEAGERD